VGNHGVKIPVAYDLNAATAPALNPDGTVAKSTCSVRPLCAAFGRTSATMFLFKPTDSHYDSLQVKFDRKWSNGFLLTTSYTYGKAIGYRSKADNDDGAPDNYLDFQRNYAVMSRNRLHTFVQSYVYELPFGRNKRFLQSGWASWVAGGWGLSGVLTRMSGVPLRFIANGNSLNAPGTQQVPNQVAPFHVLGGIDTALWFDPASFAQPTTPGTLGNMKRYAFSGPGFFNLDASLFRHFPVTERVGLELRAEAFSLTNTPQFADPITNITDPNFGHIKAANGGNRAMELSAKVTF
jgi:hypothetical protein